MCAHLHPCLKTLEHFSITMTSLSIPKFSNNQKKLILLLGCGFFAIQALFFILNFGINFTQFGDAWLIPISSVILIDDYILDTFFNEIDPHLAFFPKILILLSYLFDNLNFIHLMILGWIFLVTCLFFHFKILQNIDERLTWMIIPVAAFVFSPLQHFAFVWAFGGLQWELTVLGIVMSIYFLNKKPFKKKFIVFSIFGSLLASYSLISGITSWIAGLISFSKKSKIILIWIIIGISVLISYAYAAKSIGSSQNNLDTLLTFDSLTYILTYFSIPFRLKIPELNLLAGIVTVVMLVCVIIYFFKKHRTEFPNIIPYVQFSLITFFIAIMHVIGRIGNIELKGWLFGHTSYYAMISNLSQIALMVLLFLLVLKFWQTKRKIAILFLLIIALQIILLSPGYYLGWQWGDEYFQKNSEKYSCFSPSPKNTTLCNELFNSNTALIHSTNYLLEKQLSIFKKNEFNQNYFYDFNEINASWKNNITKMGIGDINQVNNISVSDVKSIQISENYVIVNGTLSQELDKFESIILLKDKKPFAKFDIDSNEPTLFWEFTFLSGYIEKCDEFTINGISNGNNIAIEENITICIHDNIQN